MSEDANLRKGENRIYRLIDRGPIFLGLPIIQCACLIGVMMLGFWPAKIMGGNLVGAGWVLAGMGLWSVVGFLNAQDKTYLPRLFLRMSGITMKERITSFEPSNQTIEVE